MTRLQFAIAFTCYSNTNLKIGYHRSDDIPRCSLIASDIEDQVNGSPNTTIVYRSETT